MRVLKWKIAISAIEAAGAAGLSVDAVATASGLEVCSVRAVIHKKRQLGMTDAGSRMVGGVLTFFSGEHRPPKPVQHSSAPGAMLALVGAAGASGVCRAAIRAVVSESQLERHGKKLIRAGLMASLRGGSGPDGTMYFASQELADQYLAARRAAKSVKDAKVLRVKREVKAKFPKPPKPPKVAKPKKQKVRKPKPIVLAASKPAKPDPVMAFRNRQAVIPEHIKVQVAPTPLPRFYVAEIGRHVNPAECRPWAAAAGASW